MASYVIRLCLLFVIVHLGMVYGDVSEEEEEEAELSINVLYKPEVCKKEAMPGDYITMTYAGYVIGESGNEQFDTSNNYGPVHFRLHDPASTAMQGWHQGMDGMCIKEKRELTIPPGELTANHALPNTKTPPENETLVYEVEVQNIQDKPPVGNLFSKMDFDGDQQVTKEEIHRYMKEEGLGGLDKYESNEVAINTIFSEMDRNQDGFISHSEFPGPKHDEF